MIGRAILLFLLTLLIYGYVNDSRYTKREPFIQKVELVTLVEKQNEKSLVRTSLNKLIILVKNLFTDNFFLNLTLGFFGFILLFRLFRSITGWLILFINDIIYSNPLAILGTIYDAIILYIKLFLACFSIFI